MCPRGPQMSASYHDLSLWLPYKGGFMACASCVFQGDLNGHRGLVPSNFLQAVPEEAVAEPVGAQPAPQAKKDSQVGTFWNINTELPVIYIQCQMQHVHTSLMSFLNPVHCLHSVVSSLTLRCCISCVHCMALYRSKGEVCTLRNDCKCFHRELCGDPLDLDFLFPNVILSLTHLDQTSLITHNLCSSH